MDVLVERVAGLDVHQATVTACILVSDTARKKRNPQKVRRTFGTVRAALEELKAWLIEHRVTHVAMEATGVYWKCVHDVLEDSFDLTVANARHIQNVPGRKTDVSDAEWIASLLRHGLLKKSFVPKKKFRTLRDLTRQRRGFVNDRSVVRNRIQKLLEARGVKLATYVSDVFGISGMEMLRALAKGQLGPGEMAKLARGRMRQKIPELSLALDGRLGDVHRMQLQLFLEQHDYFEHLITKIEALIAEQVAPYHAQIARLRTIPGVDQQTAIEIIGELGIDLSSFPSASHLASWAGVCPGNHQSAGKSKGGRRRKGNPYLQSILFEAAFGATRTKGSFLRAKYYRLKARRGHMRAMMAIAHRILVAVYAIIIRGEVYQELGEAHLDARDKNRVLKQLSKRLRALGFAIVPLDDNDTAKAEELLRTLQQIRPKEDQPLSP
jgi:transposase